MTYNIQGPGGSIYNPAAATITGGSVNGTPVGNSTPSTGAFSTLTAATSLTVPTMAAGNSSTNAATTAFVVNAESGIAALTSTGGSQTLTAAQYGCGILSLTGTLTSNCTLVVPTSGKWTIINGTTGAFLVAVKTSGGTGVNITQGQRNQVLADGTNVVYAVPSTASWSLQWTGGAIVANGTYFYSIYSPYAGTIVGADYITAASTSFVFAVQIDGVSVTSLSAVTVNSASRTSTSATGLNTFSAGSVITLVVTSATSSPTNAVVNLRLTKG